jgi:hypothetical protein
MSRLPTIGGIYLALTYSMATLTLLFKMESAMPPFFERLGMVFASQSLDGIFDNYKNQKKR